jgi:hypothetical protein
MKLDYFTFIKSLFISLQWSSLQNRGINLPISIICVSMLKHKKEDKPKFDVSQPVEQRADDNLQSIL